MFLFLFVSIIVVGFLASMCQKIGRNAPTTEQGTSLKAFVELDGVHSVRVGTPVSVLIKFIQPNGLGDTVIPLNEVKIHVKNRQTGYSVMDIDQQLLQATNGIRITFVPCHWGAHEIVTSWRNNFINQVPIPAIVDVLAAEAPSLVFPSTLPNSQDMSSETIEN